VQVADVGLGEAAQQQSFGFQEDPHPTLLPAASKRGQSIAGPGIVGNRDDLLRTYLPECVEGEFSEVHIHDPA
jgi:hypothetical protein